MKGCLNCKYLSKDGSHLDNDYLKEALTEDHSLYTCKHHHPFRKHWVFGIGKYSDKSASACGNQTFEPKVRQLDLFQ